MTQDRQEWYEEVKKYFSNDGQQMLMNELEIMTDDELCGLLNTDFKNPLVAILLSWFLGFIAADRFYIGDWKKGIIKLITIGGCSFWWVIDIFKIKKKTRKANDYKLRQFLGMTTEEERMRDLEDKEKLLNICDKATKAITIGSAITGGVSELHKINEDSHKVDYEWMNH